MERKVEYHGAAPNEAETEKALNELGGADANKRETHINEKHIRRHAG